MMLTAPAMGMGMGMAMGMRLTRGVSSPYSTSIPSASRHTASARSEDENGTKVRVHDRNITTAANAHVDRKTFGHLS